MNNFDVLPRVGMALDPIHVGTGGSRLGRVDNTIVRDPVTRIPKIPGSSLAGVTRAYAAMATPNKYPGCAGQGGHCGGHDCPICTVFGFAKGTEGSFAGLAAFSDMHVLLFPVATYLEAMWVTAPSALRQIKELRDSDFSFVKDEEVYGDIKDAKGSQTNKPVNLGWLMFSPEPLPNEQSIKNELKKLKIVDHILQKIVIISDKLFTHVINSNLEVRTSVSIDPATGAAEDGALFTYEALPRGTILYWEVTAKNPQHFKIGDKNVSVVTTISAVHEVVKKSDSYLEALGIGGNNTRGMGRIRVLA